MGPEAEPRGLADGSGVEPLPSHQCVSEYLEEAKPMAVEALESGPAVPGKNPGAAAQSLIGRLPNLELAADTPTKINRGGCAENGMWGVWRGNTPLTRAQEKLRRARKPHERRRMQGHPARPREVGGGQIARSVVREETGDE